VWPRRMPSFLPSGDHWKDRICSDLGDLSARTADGLNPDVFYAILLDPLHTERKTYVGSYALIGEKSRLKSLKPSVSGLEFALGVEC
jgi:hypothetical protein